MFLQWCPNTLIMLNVSLDNVATIIWKNWFSSTSDIYMIDANKRDYDAEARWADVGADVHRARFHSSMVDSKMLKTRQDFKRSEILKWYLLSV